MATIDDLEVKQLENHFIAGGFLDAFTDILGNPQPPPEFQPFELNLTDEIANSRVVMIRTTGNLNSGNRTFFKSVPMVVVVVGLALPSDSIIVNGLAIDMEKYLVESYRDSACLANIESSGVTGPFILPDGRRAYEINIQAMFNI